MRRPVRLGTLIRRIRRFFASDHNVALTTAIATIMLALVTAWLSATTQRVARLVESEIGLEHTSALVRECFASPRRDAKSGDALVRVLKNDYEFDDRLSKDDLDYYMNSKDREYLRCQLTNAGRLPLLSVRISAHATYSRTKQLDVMMPFRVIQSSTAGQDPTRVVWFESEIPSEVRIDNPDRVGYRRLDDPPEEPPHVEPLLPDLKDHWTIRKGADVVETLDQREEQPFH